MIKAFFQTEGTLTNFLLRVVLGMVIFPHGAQKLFGWFGGHGFSGTMGFFTSKMGIPALVALVVILCESLGALALLAGFMTRLVAAGLTCIMIGAVATVHWQNGFFMNWSGKQGGEGFEYHLLFMAICLVLMVSGAGKWSVDEMVAANLPERMR